MWAKDHCILIVFMSARSNNRIAFINPPLTNNRRYGQLSRAGGNEPPLGLCYLAGVMRREGFDVRIIDSQACGFGLKETADLIKTIKPKYVGITATTMAINSASELSYVLKSRDPGIKVIIGGCHVSSLPDETLEQHRFFDIGVLDEGEFTVRELILALENNIGLDNVKGIAIRKESGVYLSERRARIKNLDSLPYPAFDLLPDINRFYRLPAQSLAGRYGFSLITSRGCGGKCSFCDKKVFGNYVSMHSAEYIAEMIHTLNRNYKITNILFEDDNFMISKQRLENLIGLIGKKKLKIRWTALARVDGITKESLKLAKSGGCWQISYGIESGSRKILDFYKKGITAGQIIDVIELTKKISLKVKCFFIWGNPLEDKNSIGETSDFIEKLDIDDISITFFTPYPGSELWPDISSYGKLLKGWDGMTCFELVFVPYNLDKEFLVRTRKTALARFYLRPKVIFSYMTRLRSWAQFKELILSFYILLCYILKKN